MASPSQLDASTGTDDDAIMHREQSTAPDVVELSLSRLPFSTAGTRIHQRPLARTDSSALGGIHAWAFVRATTPGASTLSAFIPVLLSILLLWGQSVILYAPSIETMNRRCTKHEHCAVGESCMPYALRSEFGTPLMPLMPQPWRHEKTPGFCADCHSAQLTAENVALWSNASFATGAGWFGRSGADDLNGEQWFRDAAAYCDATDILPFRCDHLVERQSRLAAPHYAVLFFVVLLVLMPLVEDWDEADLEKRLLRHRTRAMGGELPLWMRCLAWVHVRMRMFRLPYCLVRATCALLFNDSTCTEFLLDGIAITFATFVDDILAQFLLPVEQREEVREAIEALIAEESRNARDPHRFLMWLFNRLYAAVLGLAVVAVNLEPESFMVTFKPLEGLVGIRGPLQCESLLIAFQACIFLCIHVMAGIWPLLRKQSVGSVLSQLVNVAGDAYCTMTFLFACVWLNPLDHFLFPAFVHDPMAIMLRWPLTVPRTIAILLFVDSACNEDDVSGMDADDCLQASMPWLAVRLGLLVSVVVLCVAVAWVRVSTSRRASPRATDGCIA